MSIQLTISDMKPSCKQLGWISYLTTNKGMHALNGNSTTRNKSDTTVMERLISDIGQAKIVEYHTTAVKNATPLDKNSINFTTPDSFQPIYEALLKSRIITSQQEELILPSLEKLHTMYADIVIKQSNCMIHSGQAQNGYPVVSIRSGSGDSLKLQLHQVPYLKQTGKVIGKDAVAQHPCHKKMCIIHAWVASKNENKSRQFCRPLLLVDNKLIWNCQCAKPKCLDISNEAYEFAIKFTQEEKDIVAAKSEGVEEASEDDE